MSIVSFFNGITLLSIFVASVLVLFFILTKKGRKIENILLGSLLFLFSLQIVYSFAVSNYTFQFYLRWHKILYLLRQTSLLTGPILYLYLRSFSNKNRIADPKLLLHGLPFIAVSIFLFFYMFGIDHFVIWKSPVDLVDTILILTSNLFYIILSVAAVKSIHPTFRAFFDSVRQSTSITWVHMLLLGFVMIWVMNVNSFAVIMIVQRPGWCAYTGSIFTLVVFLFMNSMMFLILLKPDIYYIVEKYKGTKVDEAGREKYLQHLNDYMESHKPYLDPDVSLETIARDCSINRRILSQVINEHCHTNFKGFINEFRLRECIRLLSRPENSRKTILEIGFEVGFNSKSVFNSQFKKYTGTTPQEYRSKALERPVDGSRFEPLVS